MSVELVLPQANNFLEGLDQIQKAIAAFEWPEQIKTIALWNERNRGSVTLDKIDRPEDLLIIFWGAPEKCDLENLARHVYYNINGKDLTAWQRNGFRIREVPRELRSIFDDIPDPAYVPREYPIAYQWYNTLLIPFDLPHGKTQIQHVLGLIFSKIDFSKVIRYSPPPITETFLPWWQLFMESQAGGLSIDVRQQLESEILARQRRALEDQERLEKDNQIKVHIEKLKETLGLRFQAEIDAILACPNVSHVKISANTSLSVITGPITLELMPNGGGKGSSLYDLGQLEIMLNSTKKGRGAIRIQKVGNSNDPCHPHISSDGVPCFGNIRELCETLLSQGEIAALVTTIMQYLQSPTDGADTYFSLANFSLVEQIPNAEGMDDGTRTETPQVVAAGAGIAGNTEGGAISVADYASVLRQRSRANVNAYFYSSGTQNGN